MTSFKSTYPFSAFGGKIDPISELRNSGLVTSGDVYWVKDPSDDDYLSFKDAVGGSEYCYDTIQEAINKCTNDQNDYVMVCPKKDMAVWQLSAAIDLNKDKVHLISVGYGRQSKGYSNILEGYAATTTHDDEFLHITGSGCEVAGFYIHGTGAGTAATGYGTISNGLLYFSGTCEDVWVHDCTVRADGSNAAVWDTLAGVVAGSVGVKNVRLTNVSIETGTALTTGTTVLLGVGGACKDWTVEDCTFKWWNSATTNRPINIGTGDIGALLFDQCKFLNINAATAPASLCTGNIAAESGIALFHFCSAVGVTAYGTDTEVYVAPTASGTSAGAKMQNTLIAIVGTCASPTT